MNDRRYGVSTHLFHDQRLTRDHFVQIAAYGFETVELFATRSHVDYRDAAAVSRIGEWLKETRLELHSVHAPIVDALRAGEWIGSYSNAAGNEDRRTAAVAEAGAALRIAELIPFRFLVVHLGVPTGVPVPPNDNVAEAARRSLEEIAALAARVHVQVAVEVIPNTLSDAAALVRLIEEQLEGIDIGICLDYGHAHLMGDVGEAIETLSGHLITTHVHDNGGRRDDHLVPFEGTIDWDQAMIATQKIGYDGVFLFEVANTGDAVDVLQRCVKARERLGTSFVAF